MSAYNHYQMSVHAKIDPIFHAWYTYIKKIYKKKIKVKIAIEKFWCVKYYKAQPYNMEHTLCVCHYAEANNQLFACLRVWCIFHQMLGCKV